jgi:hypothetical protein
VEAEFGRLLKLQGRECIGAAAPTPLAKGLGRFAAHSTASRKIGMSKILKERVP